MVVYEQETQKDRQHAEQYFSLPALPNEILVEIPKEWIDRLFVRLWAWYGKMIEEKWGADTELAKSVWQQDLAGLTMQQLKLGMERCRDNCKFPPNLPEFRALCLGSTKIDAEQHWKICVSGRYECLAHYWAVQHFGYSEFHSTPWSKAKYKFPSLLRDLMIEERAGKLRPMPDHVAKRFA